MSASDRAALVQQLKQDQENRQQSLISLVHDMMNGQAKSYSLATGDDSIWRFLSSGNFTVDAATKAQAQADIAEDGYWGIAQTSQRLFDFASALAGDDVEKMQKMQQAMEKDLSRQRLRGASRSRKSAKRHWRLQTSYLRTTTNQKKQSK